MAGWLSLPPASAGFFLGSFFLPEDGSDVLFRNVGLGPNYAVLQPKARALNICVLKITNFKTAIF
jgi:hypothetical protein